jgi:hypothetical protein
MAARVSSCLLLAVLAMALLASSLRAQPVAEEALAITAIGGGTTTPSNASSNLTSLAQSLNVTSGLLATAPTTLATTAGLGARPNTSR